MCAFSFRTSELEFGEEPPLNSIAFCADCEESPQGLEPVSFVGFSARLNGLRKSSSEGENHPSAAKAGLNLQLLRHS
jgi:hypothetical protein